MDLLLIALLYDDRQCQEHSVKKCPRNKTRVVSLANWLYPLHISCFAVVNFQEKQICCFFKSDFLQIPIDCNMMNGQREIIQKKYLIDCVFDVVRGVLASALCCS